MQRHAVLTMDAQLNHLSTSEQLASLRQELELAKARTQRCRDEFQAREITLLNEVFRLKEKAKELKAENERLMSSSDHAKRQKVEHKPRDPTEKYTRELEEHRKTLTTALELLQEKTAEHVKVIEEQRDRITELEKSNINLQNEGKALQNALQERKELNQEQVMQEMMDTKHGREGLLRAIDQRVERETKQKLEDAALHMFLKDREIAHLKEELDAFKSASAAACSASRATSDARPSTRPCAPPAAPANSSNNTDSGKGLYD
jgi:chromosome segregation ATPase